MRVLVQVDSFCSGPDWLRARMLEIDGDQEQSHTAVCQGPLPASKQLPQIIVRASAKGLRKAEVQLQISTDEAAHSVAAVAAKSIRQANLLAVEE